MYIKVSKNDALTKVPNLPHKSVLRYDKSRMSKFAELIKDKRVIDYKTLPIRFLSENLKDLTLSRVISENGELKENPDALPILISHIPVKLFHQFILLYLKFRNPTTEIIKYFLQVCRLNKIPTTKKLRFNESLHAINRYEKYGDIPFYQLEASDEDVLYSIWHFISDLGVLNGKFINRHYNYVEFEHLNQVTMENLSKMFIISNEHKFTPQQIAWSKLKFDDYEELYVLGNEIYVTEYNNSNTNSQKVLTKRDYEKFDRINNVFRLVVENPLTKISHNELRIIFRFVKKDIMVLFNSNRLRPSDLYNGLFSSDKQMMISFIQNRNNVKNYINKKFTGDLLYYEIVCFQKLVNDLQESKYKSYFDK